MPLTWPSYYTSLLLQQSTTTANKVTRVKEGKARESSNPKNKSALYKSIVSTHRHPPASASERMLGSQACNYHSQLLFNFKLYIFLFFEDFILKEIQ